MNSGNEMEYNGLILIVEPGIDLYLKKLSNNGLGDVREHWANIYMRIRKSCILTAAYVVVEDVAAILKELDDFEGELVKMTKNSPTEADRKIFVELFFALESLHYLLEDNM